MSADFWAGYASGALGILVGNPWDLLKTRIQAGTSKSPQVKPPELPPSPIPPTTAGYTAWLRGAAAPILGYGALNALLFVTYNRSLALLNNGNLSEWPENPSGWTVWTAGALGGLATFVVSAPTELIKCRAQVSNPPQSSVEVATQMWKQSGLRGLYLGGSVTSVRDAVGYGFYFWSYDLCTRVMAVEGEGDSQRGLKVLLAGGIAGIATWASIFPLDVIKTRVQTWDLLHASQASLASPIQPLLCDTSTSLRRPSTWKIAKDAYVTEGFGVFFRGLGVCSARAFLVNAVQWAVYEYLMRELGR